MLTDARFIKDAELEFEHAVDHYEAERSGLGVLFAERVEATLLQAMHFPEGGTLVTHPRIRRNVRRFRVHPPFPFDLVATIFDEQLVVLAVSHHKREPSHWIRRLDQLTP